MAAALMAGCGDGEEVTELREATGTDTATTGQSALSSRSPRGYGLRVRTDRHLYTPGDTIRIQVTAFNHTGRRIRRHFPTVQRFDVVLRRQRDGPVGEPIWRWSADRSFLEQGGTEAFGPDRPVAEYRIERPAPSRPGIYLLEAEIVASKWPMSASVPLTVAP